MTLRLSDYLLTFCLHLHRTSGLGSAVCSLWKLKLTDETMFSPCTESPPTNYLSSVETPPPGWISLTHFGNLDEDHVAVKLARLEISLVLVSFYLNLT